MAFVSFETVAEILKQCEGKTFLEAMDSLKIDDVWKENLTVRSPDGSVKKYQIPNSYDRWYERFRVGPPEIYKATPEVKAILQGNTNGRGAVAIAKVYAAPTPPPSSTPQAKEPDTDHMWDMLVLAARSSRYGD
jgi:hypothetical protein